MIGTHALLPVGVCLAADCVRLASGRDRMFPPWSLWAVGVFGVLPDLCSPHLSLADRYASWSHTGWFVAGACVLAAAAGSCFESGRRLGVGLACWAAVALHLAADAVSGGIVCWAPVSDAVLGGAYLPFWLWWWSDLVLIGAVWWLRRLSVALEVRWLRRGKS